jgi:hypothetical protein
MRRLNHDDGKFNTRIYKRWIPNQPQKKEYKEKEKPKEGWRRYNFSSSFQI